MSHLQRFRELEAQGIDILALLAGDRALDDEQLQGILENLGPLGPEYHSDLMELLTHRRFEPEQAQDLWRGIIRHKKKLENRLERSVGVRVAAADYLTNRRPTLQSPRIVPRSEMDQLVSQVSLDPLTGLLNRRFIDQTLRLEMQRTRRYGGLFTVLLIDLDHFKKINDEHGHVAGDEALVDVSRRIQAVSRETDILGRWGGDELLLILPQTSADDARILTGRLRHDIRQRPLVFHNGDHCNATISIGIASYPDHGQTVQELLESASSALRAAKTAGRDTERVAEAGKTEPLRELPERRWGDFNDDDPASDGRESDR
ncbi:MAG: GGDEF domain-containing protein [Planctomycetota bacterium]|nr:GGDEF domain-containing protein [Planctomycetota bacterium]